MKKVKIEIQRTWRQSNGPITRTTANAPTPAHALREYSCIIYSGWSHESIQLSMNILFLFPLVPQDEYVFSWFSPIKRFVCDPMFQYSLFSLVVSKSHLSLSDGYIYTLYIEYNMNDVRFNRKQSFIKYESQVTNLLDS